MPAHCYAAFAARLPACLRQCVRRPASRLLSGLLLLASCGNESELPVRRPAATAARLPALAAETSAPHAHATAAQTVAPGLEVRIASAVPTDTAGKLYPEHPLVLTIERNGQVIFQDTTADGLAYAAYSEPQTDRLYPLWLPTGPAMGELLVAYSGRPNRDKVRRFRIKGQRVVRIDTLTAFDGPARNLDQDAWLEYRGYADYGESWDDAQGHHQTYNPLLCYEVRPTGLVLDTALTIRRNRARYGKFYGYRYSEKPVIITKQPSKQRK